MTNTARPDLAESRQPRSRPFAVLVCIALACLTACSTLGGGAQFERARAIAQRAEAEALAGRPDAAIEAVRSALAETEPQSRAEALLHFTLGWLYANSAGDGVDRVERLEQAAGYYRKVLETAPANLPARQNLALVLVDLDRHDRAITVLEAGLNAGEPSADTEYEIWTSIGGIHEARGDATQAIAAFERALRVRPGDAAAAERIVALSHALSNEELDAYARRFADSGAVLAALRSLEELIRRLGGGPEADAALVRWVELAAAENELDPSSLDRLPPPGDLPSSLRAELVDLVNHPVRERDEPETLEHWTDTLERRHVIAMALQCLAGKRLARLRPTDVAAMRDVERIYQRALDVAPTTDEYRASDELQRRRSDPRAPGPPDVRLDVAIDLAVLYHSYRYDLDPTADRFRALFDGPDAPLSLDQFDRVERTTDEEVKYNGLLGIIYGSLDDWLTKPEDRERAIVFLRRAIEKSDRPVPRLNQVLAEVLVETDRPVLAMDSYVDAARGYLELDARNPALDLLPPASDVTHDSRARLEERLLELEDLLYPPWGFYVGGNVGITDRRASSGSLQSSLTNFGHGGVSADLDDTDFGFKLFGGYRFDAPLSLELGFTSLGGPDSSVGVAAPNPSRNLRSDVEAEHPLSGYGVSLAVVAYPYQSGRFALTTKVGAWVWEAATDVDLNGIEDDIDDDGIDPFLGAGLQYRISRRIYGRLDYERYYLDDEGTDFYSVGLVYKF